MQFYLLFRDVVICMQQHGKARLVFALKLSFSIFGVENYLCLFLFLWKNYERKTRFIQYSFMCCQLKEVKVKPFLSLKTFPLTSLQFSNLLPPFYPNSGRPHVAVRRWWCDETSSPHHRPPPGEALFASIYDDLDLRYFFMMNNLGPVECKLETFWDIRFRKNTRQYFECNVFLQWHKRFKKSKQLSSTKG